MNITKKQIPQGHYEKGRSQFRPEIIVIHIGQGSQEAIYQEFCNTEKSSHYSVAYDGTIWQFVDEIDTAYGNGILSKPTAKIVLQKKGLNPNLYSISIEHEGMAEEDITEDQYQATSSLVADICKRWLIPLDRDHIIGHREIRADKTCPGKINIEKIIFLAQSKRNPPESSPLEKIMLTLAILTEKIRQFIASRSKK